MWEVRYWNFENELCVVNGFESSDEARAWLRQFISKMRPNLRMDLTHVPFWIPSAMPDLWHSQAANEEFAWNRLHLLMQPADNLFDLAMVFVISDPLML